MKTKKAMKKITHIGMAALVAMGMLGTSCNKAESPEIETPETQKENIVTLTTTVGFAADGTKALTDNGVKTFAKGETMAIYYWKNKGTVHEKAVSAPLTAGDITNGGKSATFTFTLDNPYKDVSVVYTYPAAMANADFTPNYDALYNNQDGTLATLASDFDFCTKSGAWAGDNLPSLTLENQLAILAITLKNEAGTSEITGSTTKLTVSDGTNTYNVNRSATAGPIYVAIRPTEDATITVTATDGTKNYAKTLTGKTYAKGNGYPVSWKMAEAAPAYKLLSAATAEDYGKVVCEAGHLHDSRTAVPAGCTAVGILGKVTETGCGLILALNDATSQTWNTINGWTPTTDFAGGTTLKVLPDDAARGANLTSYTLLGTTVVSDWAVAQKSDYEEIFTNLGSTTGDSNGKTYDTNVNAYITTGVGGDAITGNYWSATEIKLTGYAYYFYSDGWTINDKSVSLSVRPVLGFGGEAKLLSAATAEDICKVVCADGHLHDAKTAVPAGRPAVGILGKVTETGHGLILALQDATAQGCYTINKWTSVTTYAGTTLMVLPDDAARGSLASYTTLGETTVSNWAVAQKSDYSAIFQNLGSTVYNNDSYTYDDNVNEYFTTGVGGTALSGYYWSATEYVDVDAWGFSSDKWDYDYKPHSHSVRPVLAF